MLNEADMNFSSQEKQLQIDAFRSSLEGLFKEPYNSRLNNGKRGAGNKHAHDCWCFSNQT